MKKTFPGWSFKTYLKYKIIWGSVVASCVFILTAIPASAVGGSNVLFEKSCGSDNINGKRVLVAYDSKHGSTADIAEKIGDVLCENGFRVDMRPALKVEDISPYDAIVIGSPMYYATFLPGALKFLERHKNILAVKKVALFVTSTSVDKETGMVNKNLLRLISSSVLNKFPEIKIIEPIGLMPGKFYFKEIFPVEVINFKQTNYDEVGDLLNYDFVRSWTEEIAILLK
jgi:menaquinone-dependent protoporphyrinogen oxidase